MTGIAKPKETFAIRIGEDWHVVVPAKAREYRIEPGDSDVWMDHRSTALICMAGKEDAKISLTADPRAIVAAALEQAIDDVHHECWTDGDGGPATDVLLAEQDTTALAIRTIRALIDTDHAAALEAVRAEARAEEREACLEVADEIANRALTCAPKEYEDGFADGAGQVADAIRARGASE